ncbi:no exine formation 1 [Wolffia australiana]
MMFDESFYRQSAHQRGFAAAAMSAPSFPVFASRDSDQNRGSMAGWSTPPPSSSSSSRNPSSRLQPQSSFAHNGRIAVALVPAAAFLLDLGGSIVLSLLIVGLMISYILDSLRLKLPSFFAVWFSLLVSQIAFFFASSARFPSLPLTVLAMFLCAETNFLIGVWASLQFKWLQIENPTIVVALERLLFSCLPIVAPALFSWAVVLAVGMGNSAFYYMVFACFFYWVFSLPRPSSFKTKHEAENHILGSLECCLHTLHLLFVPLCFHMSSHYSTTFSSFSSFCDLLLLFFVPFLFQLYASTRGALWWVTKDEGQVHSIRVVNGAIAMFVVAISLEVRVVFRSFGRYLHAPPPLNYFLVTVVMLGGSSAVGAYILGLVGDAFSSMVFTVLLVVISGAGAVVVGFPKLFIFVPLLAGYYLGRFFTKRSLQSYFSFVALATLVTAWFVVENYWDLNIWMAGMPLKSFCKLIVASVFLAMSIPGLILLPSNLRFVGELGLIGHALLLCYIEDRFYNYTNMYWFGLDDEVMYPSYMVIGTTALGLALVRKLAVDCRIGPKTVWIVTCLHLSKLPMLFISSRSVLWVSALLLLAVSPPLLLYKSKTKTASRMKAWQAFTHAGVIAIAAWLCRETLFEALRWLNGRPPSDGLLLGSYLLLTALACVPIVVRHFSHVQAAKRSLVLVVSAGLLFILLQPPVPLSWAYKSELIKSAHQTSDDISIYGFAVSHPTWPSWLLIIAILLTLSAVTSAIPIKYVVELRAFYAIGAGFTLGLYICAEYFFQSLILYPLLVAAMVSTAIFMVFTHLPSASSPRILPWVFALLVALLPVTYLLEGQLRARSGEEEAIKVTNLLAVEGARMSLLGLNAMIFLLIALEIKFDLSAMMREKAAERGSGQTNLHSGFPPRQRLSQQRRAAGAPSFTIKRLSAEAAWMPAVGNVSTFLCFLLCVVINTTLTGGSNRAIFFLAPILLLLNQDSDIFSGFGDRQRYFPVVLAVSVYLFITAVQRIWAEVWSGDSGWALEIGGPGWVFAVKNAGLLILTLPNHILFSRFMWDYVKQTDGMLLLTMPLNLPSIVITDVSTIRVLGLLGVIYSLAQYLISRRTRIAGMKFI